MTAKVIQGSFLGGQPKLPPPIQARTVARPPGPPMPAFSAHPPGSPVPAFAGRPGVVQRHGAGGAFAVEAGQVGLLSGGGRPLPEAVRGKMEAALGASFADVRVHVGPQAERIGAIAFTLGSDIYFAPGRFQPDTAHGQQLLGHELAHVVQQRQGRVRNPLGSGIAVVQDHALEAEADRTGQRAAAHRIVAQPKMPPGAVQPSSPVRISPPANAGPGSYRLTAGAGGRQVGSVMVHARDRGVVEVSDLGVDQSQRGHGIGQMLVASAAKTGLQFGRSKVTLAAQDKGSGHLTRWYKEMGFTQTGVNRRGYPQLEAPISRVIAEAAQQRALRDLVRQVGAGLESASLRPGGAVEPVQRRSGAILPLATTSLGQPRFVQAKAVGAGVAHGGLLREVIQLAKKVKEAEDKERRQKAEAFKQEQQKKAAAQKEAAAQEDAQKKREEARQKQVKIDEIKKREEKNKREMALKPPSIDEDTRLKHVVAGADFRRLETVARLLETAENICVAIAKGEDGQIYATTNRGKLNSLVYQEQTLWVGESVHPSVEGENPLEVRARKVSAYITTGNIAEQINGIQHVCDKMSGQLHAEMKMLNFITKNLKQTKPTEVFISKVCCANCSRALAFWAAKSKIPKIIYRHQSSGSEWPGWQCPPCIEEKELNEWIALRGQERGRDLSLTSVPTRRERSMSPAPKPKGAKAQFGSPPELPHTSGVIEHEKKGRIPDLTRPASVSIAITNKIIEFNTWGEASLQRLGAGQRIKIMNNPGYDISDRIFQFSKNYDPSFFEYPDIPQDYLQWINQ